MFKDTPVLSTITVSELLRVAIIEGGRTFRYIEPITMVGLIFLLMSYPSSIAVRRLEGPIGTTPAIRQFVDVLPDTRIGSDPMTLHRHRRRAKDR